MDLDELEQIDDDDTKEDDLEEDIDNVVPEGDIEKESIVEGIAEIVPGPHVEIVVDILVEMVVGPDDDIPPYESDVGDFQIKSPGIQISIL